MTQNNPGRAGSVLVMLAALGACSETRTGDLDRVVVRDSAGVAVVENTGPAWTNGPGWAIGSEPIQRIESDGAGFSLFNVVFAAELGDGRIVIVNAGSRTIEWLDAAGAHLRSTGGAGEGPGEFRGITWAGLTASDSLYVWDGQARRMSIYADQGFVRSFGMRTPEPWGAVSIGGLLADGSVVVLATPLPGGDGQEGVARPEVPAWIMSPDGEVMADLGTFSGAPVDLRPGATPGTFIRRVIPFGPRTVIGAAGDLIAVGDSETYELALHDSQGALQRIVRVPEGAARVSASDLEAELERRLEVAPPIEEIRDGIRANFESTPVPEFMPFFNELLIDPSGYVWVGRPGTGGSDEGRQWD
jgi:hypothetical protein